MRLEYIALGGTICYLIWPLHSWWLDRISCGRDFAVPKGVDRKVWQQIVRGDSLEFSDDEAIHRVWWDSIRQFPAPGGVWLGILERVLCFSAALVNAPVLVAGWFAFKVASSWQVWQHLVQVPRSSDDDLSRRSTENLLSRYQWGAEVHTRILLGTLSNAIIGGLVAYLMLQISK